MLSEARNEQLKVRVDQSLPFSENLNFKPWEASCWS